MWTKFAAETVSSLNPMFREKDITVSINAGENIPNIKTDKRALRQVLVNLLSNAVKFSEPGSDISVDIERRIKSLDIAVTDHGCGIGADAINKLGTEYFREQQEVGPEGNGLGLSIVYRLIEQMDGAIRVESEQGKGSTFTASLPLSGAQAKPVPADPRGDVVYLKPKTKTHNNTGAAMPMADARLGAE